jgi:hypothetical protein
MAVGQREAVSIYCLAVIGTISARGISWYTGSRTLNGFLSIPPVRCRLFELPAHWSVVTNLTRNTVVQSRVRRHSEEL